MEILGYIAFAVLIFLAITWTIGVRTQLDAGTHTIVGALFFLVSVLILFISGASKVHALWLVPVGFVVPFAIVFFGNISRVFLVPFRLLAGVFASVVRIGIPAERIRAAQEAGLRATGEEWSRQRNSTVQTDDKIAAVHQYLLEIIRIIRASLNASGVDMRGEKTFLAQGLFYMGFVDALHQATKMTDDQFIELQKFVFNDLNFNAAFSAKIFLFHQTGQISHPAFKAIMAGGKFFGRLTSGDKAVESMLAGDSIAEFVRDPSFPSSAARL